MARTHPDGGHGAFVLAAPPADGTTLAQFPLRAGRWLRPDDDDAVVLSDRGAPIGARIELTVDGRVSAWTVVGVVDELAGRSAFVTPAAFRRVTGQAGPTLLRIAADPGALPGVERALDGVPVIYALPIHGLHSIIADHVAMVVRAVVALAAVVAAVGLLGLAIAMGVSVAERTGELGVMRAIGASDRRLVAVVVGEAMAIGAVAVIAALALTAPLTALVVDRVAVIGQPPFALSPPAMIGWSLAALIGSALASLAPARRAIRMSVRAALAEA
ncbi:MAG: ABC transporter permease [Myxococcales bacterium]|nr:ABC transporter permease [Myxococcales bacterium]